MLKRTCSLAVASFAVVLGMGAGAPALAASVAGCATQANAPVVVHRVLPSQNEANAPAARSVVVVTLARTGHILAVHLDRSSRSAGFDRAALAAARATSFAPAARGCVAVDTTFRYVVARDESHQLTAAVLPAK
jgi:TonB family protein